MKLLELKIPLLLLNDKKINFVEPKFIRLRCQTASEQHIIAISNKIGIDIGMVLPISIN